MTTYIAKTPNAEGRIDFNAEEHETWQLLYTRQMSILPERACDEYLKGLEILKLPQDHIPQCADISARLLETTGWAVEPVQAIIPLQTFFSLLANRRFPAATFIRRREDLDYLQEPDIFHEYFGHCPLLTHPAYADFVQWYGENALKAGKNAQSLLGRLFWFTIEFGLVQSAKGLRIYGGGILSSYQETLYALESDTPTRTPFDIKTILQTPYRYDQIQTHYFTLSHLHDLFQMNSEQVMQFIEEKNDNNDKDFVIC